MLTYLVTHKKTNKQMLFKYDLNGFLIVFKTNINMNDATVDYFKKEFPFKVSELNHYKASKIFRVDEVKQDLSFKAFWDSYSHKVGNKPRAEKLWNALKDLEKAKALSYIAKYNDFLLNNQGIQKLYPETYLNQKRFDNE
jgi:hypothetical protein